MAININTPAASAFGDLLELALKMGGQSREQQWRSQEAEKDRQFRESQEYLRNMLNQEGLIIEDILQAEDDLTFYNINVEGPMQRLQDFQTSTATAGGKALSQLNGEIKQQRISDLISIRSDLSKMKGRFSEGQSVADVMDINKDNFLDEKEIGVFESAERARTGDPNFTLSEPFVQGARNRIADPQYQLAKLQLEGEKSKQEEFELDREKRQYERDIKKLEYEDLQGKVGKELAGQYRQNDVLSIGTASWQDLATAEAVKREWSMMRPDFLHAMVLNTPVDYIDPNPQQIDKEDIRYAIIPAIRDYAKEQLNNPDFMDAVGISNQDVSGNTDKYKIAIEKITANALAGVRENPAYTLKTQEDIYRAVIQEKETISKVFNASELSTYNNSVATLASTLPLDAISGAPQEVVIDNIKANLKASGITWSEDKIQAEYLKLRGAAEPYVLAQTIALNPDSKLLLKAAGQDVFIPIMEKALQHVSGSVIKPVKRKARKKKPAKTTRSPYEEAFDFNTTEYNTAVLQQYGMGTMGQANLDARIKEAAVLSIDIRRAKEDNNIALQTDLAQKLALVEIQIQQLQSQGFQSGSGSLKDITLELIR